MRWGVGGSLAFHAVLAILIIGVFPFAAPDLPPIPPNIPVDLVTVGDVTNIKQIDKVDTTQKDEQKPAEPEPEPQRQAALPPTPEVKPAPEPEPMPAPPPPPDAAKPQPAPAPKPEEKKPEEKKPEVKPVNVNPPPKKEQAFDASKIAALLNKLPTKSQASEQGEKALSTGPQKTERVGAGTAMTATWNDLLQEQFKRCWNVQGGAQDAAKQIVIVHVELNPDGSLAAPPTVVNRMEVEAGGDSYKVAAERALRAVRTCNPLKQLPPEHYSEWRSMDFHFNPAAMLGG